MDQENVKENAEESPVWGEYGYPYFTQYDPREGDDAKRKYSVQLFQMDSDYGEDNDYILWEMPAWRISSSVKRTWQGKIFEMYCIHGIAVNKEGKAMDKRITIQKGTDI